MPNRNNFAMDKQKKVKLERNLCDIYFESLWDLIYLLLLIVRGQSPMWSEAKTWLQPFFPAMPLIVIYVKVDVIVHLNNNN